jgi:hypothetical protein
MNLYRRRSIPPGSFVHDAAFLRGQDYAARIPSSAVRVSTSRNQPVLRRRLPSASDHCGEIIKSLIAVRLAERFQVENSSGRDSFTKSHLIVQSLMTLRLSEQHFCDTCTQVRTCMAEHQPQVSDPDTTGAPESWNEPIWER